AQEGQLLHLLEDDVRPDPVERDGVHVDVQVQEELQIRSPVGETNLDGDVGPALSAAGGECRRGEGGEEEETEQARDEAHRSELYLQLPPGSRNGEGGSGEEGVAGT